MKKPKVTGIEQTMANINKAIANITDHTVGGLLAGGLIIQRAAQEGVPVEYGHLKSTAYTRKAIDNPKAVEIGFSASYAVYVHENMQQKLKGQARPSGLGVYWGPKGRPKFLELAAKEKKSEVVEAIVRHAKSGAK